jgi:formylglycine-generating enzyme required for sulfatase activity
MGSPPTEEGRFYDESQYRVRIGRTFAIAAKPVTVAQYQVFDRTYVFPFLQRFAPQASCPVLYTSWYEAAKYCNWLSDKENLPRCYETDGNEKVTALKKDYLSLTGYRLPTEAEWEYTCRAEAVTSRYYGESTELLGKYGWCLQNSGERSRPVGSKKPNDFGLFDMHGNVWNWCQESYKPYPQGPSEKIFEDIEDTLSVDKQASRVLRGGSYNNRAANVRCAYRNEDAPTHRNGYVGFRPARTFR